jgi:membrane-bound metal-dependent hydrolase YbcI (DUF457 family)
VSEKDRGSEPTASVDALLGGPDAKTSRELHLLSVVPIAFLAVIGGYLPWVAVPLVAGVLLPELDAVDRRLHRSWLLHTFMPPTVAYWLLARTGLAETSPWLVTAVHFLALGMLVHFLADYVYPRGMDNPGAEWPVRPVFFSAPWGLIWLGTAWFVQWFLYLSPAFLPWLALHV